MMNLQIVNNMEARNLELLFGVNALKSLNQKEYKKLMHKFHNQFWN
jgi:hypothetical protein